MLQRPMEAAARENVALRRQLAQMQVRVWAFAPLPRTVRLAPRYGPVPSLARRGFVDVCRQSCSLRWECCATPGPQVTQAGSRTALVTALLLAQVIPRSTTTWMLL